jgi:hypothetical protein
MNTLGDLLKYKGVLPYAAENFAVYQPLLGWKSKRTMSRIQLGFQWDQMSRFQQSLNKFVGNMTVGAQEGRLVVQKLAPAMYATPGSQPLGTTLLKELAAVVPANSPPESWSVVTPAFLQGILDRTVLPQAQTDFQALSQGNVNRTGVLFPADPTSQHLTMIKNRLQNEAAAAGLVLALHSANAFDALNQLVYGLNPTTAAAFLASIPSDPLDTFDPRKDLDRVGLSPIGIAHLFRQYFFELDTFLGTPVGHVWLSPGSTVELIEISTRKTVTEQTQEVATQTSTSTESSKTAQDDLADAVKDSNTSNTKFGASVTANENWGWGSASETASIDMGSTQSNARETAHKEMSAQSSKLSQQITKNFKSTFKTVSETTDTSSRRYVLNNTTDKLINYELRRKMRQLAVQVQDVGCYLCWQRFVDDPGATLGVANLVHVAAPPSGLGDTDPTNEPAPTNIVDNPQNFTYQWPSDDAVTKNVTIRTISLTPPKTGYIFDHATVNLESSDHYLPLDSYGDSGHIVKIDDGTGKGTEDSYEAVRVYIKVEGNSSYPKGLNIDKGTKFPISVAVTYKPSKAEILRVTTDNSTKKTLATNEKVAAFKAAFITAAQDRIKEASNIVPRAYDDLREEERIVVYRQLVQDVLMNGFDTHPNTIHLVSELLNSIFDVDKMLYFVAPEWWRNLREVSQQDFGSLVPDPNGSPDGSPMFVPAGMTKISAENVADWGGGSDTDRRNYYITGDSSPAKLGSSLGWLLQLDGDDLRNAFLNAPWVKAIIPIRPGKELAAINWLQNVEGMDGLSDDYSVAAEQGGARPKMLDVIKSLAKQVSDKYKASMTVPAPTGDPASTVTTTPIERVYEQGFDPQQKGFQMDPVHPFEIFDQWTEILPTDQIVPVEVAYDPKTGRLM